MRTSPSDHPSKPDRESVGVGTPTMRMLDTSVLERVEPPDRNNPSQVVDVEKFELLRGGKAALDSCRELTSPTNGFTGQAPDLEAFEHGEPLPLYGPLAA